MERTGQKRIVAINRGLFLVRYTTAEDEKQPPKVMVAVDPASAKDITFLLHPDHKDAVLWQPDTCLVVRAIAAGQLAVEVVPQHEGGSVAATVRIEPLNQSTAAPASKEEKRSQPQRDKSPGHDLGNVRILGHVAGIGDVVVHANQWIAGPSAPSRIEGIVIEWPDKPADLDIQYAVKTAKPQATSGRKNALGSFAGTRGKAMPIVGLLLELSGPAASKFQFLTEAIFLGAPAMRIKGKRVVAAGPTGREPLVGLRIALEAADDAAARPPVEDSAAKTGGSERRVRVFRPRTKQDQSAAV